jgi:hypothetical protein
MFDEMANVRIAGDQRYVVIYAGLRDQCICEPRA